MMALFTSVFCTSTKTPTEASTRDNSSTARIAWKNDPPAPPNSSGVSIPISPRSKHCFKSEGSRWACSSISSTRLRISPSANSRTLSRNICSSSERVVRGRARDSSMATCVGVIVGTHVLLNRGKVLSIDLESTIIINDKGQRQKLARLSVAKKQPQMSTDHADCICDRSVCDNLCPSVVNLRRSIDAQLDGVSRFSHFRAGMNVAVWTGRCEYLIFGSLSNCIRVRTKKA